MNRKRLSLFLVLAALVGLACTALAWRLNRPVARVNGEAISASDLARELQSRFGDEVLQDLVGERLVAQAARQYDLDLPPGELSQWIADFRQRPDVQVALASGRLDEARLRRNLSTVVPLYHLVLQPVPEEERVQFFRDHRARFEEIRARHILLGSEGEALELRGRIRGASDFPTLAAVHSLDDRTRAGGGDLGPVTRAELEASFEAEDVQALFTLAPGTVSEPLQARSGGWHLFLVEGRRVDYQGLRRRVMEVMAQDRVAPYLDALRARARIDLLLPREAGPSPGPGSPSPTPSGARP